ncbi:STAS domain-containing protein [Streptomyces californicus]|uniref:STAS domain-containing protein n=1 Tax=Streptomyces californicus TaxID=67351 RepID=UPI003719BB82
MATVEGSSPGSPIVAELLSSPAAWLVRLDGEIDLDVIEPLHLAVAEAARASLPLVMDCSRVTFADSSFLNTALLAIRSVPVHLAGVRGPLSALLKITNTASVFELHADVPAALQRCHTKESAD